MGQVGVCLDAVLGSCIGDRLRDWALTFGLWCTGDS